MVHTMTTIIVVIVFAIVAIVLLITLILAVWLLMLAVRQTREFFFAGEGRDNDREELARGSFIPRAELDAMDDATVARLVALMRDRADVARDYDEER